MFATPDAAAILRRLAPRNGLSLGALQSGRFDEFRVLLAAAATSVASGVDHSEREVNDRLRAWLAGPGSMLATDHVELRRWLVDSTLLERDGFGRRYARNPSPAEPYVQALAALAGVDVEAIVERARREDAAAREARRAAHARRTGG